MVKKLAAALAGLTRFAAVLAGISREQLAGGSMAAGIASIGLGVGIVFGAGFGILALGVCLVGVAILLGWT